MGERFRERDTHFTFERALPLTWSVCDFFAFRPSACTYRRPPSKRAMCFSRRGVNNAAGVYREIVNDGIGGVAGRPDVVFREK